MYTFLYIKFPQKYNVTFHLYLSKFLNLALCLRGNVFFYYKNELFNSTCPNIHLPQNFSSVHQHRDKKESATSAPLPSVSARCDEVSRRYGSLNR